MKSFLISFLVLGSLQVLATEVPIRLTDKNISSIVAIPPTECTPNEVIHGFDANYLITISLKDKRTVTINTMDNQVFSCKDAMESSSRFGRILLNKLNKIKSGDLSVRAVGEDIKCLKRVGSIAYDEVTGIGTNFEEQTTVVACPE